MGTKVKLTNVRLFFPDLFEAKEFKPGDGKFRFSATFGILKTDAAQLQKIEAAIQAEAAEVWKAKSTAMVDSLRGNSNKFCLTDGDLKTYEGAEGMKTLAAHRKKTDGRPLVLDRNKAPVVEGDGVIYSGCYVNASVEFWIQAKGEGAPGIRCTLLGVQKFADGDSFSGASKPKDDDFDDLSDTGDGSNLV